MRYVQDDLMADLVLLHRNRLLCLTLVITAISGNY